MAQTREMEVAAPSSGCILKIKIRQSFSQLASYCASHATDFDGQSTKEAIFTNMASRVPKELSREVDFCFRMRPGKQINTGHLIIAPSIPFRDKDDLERAVSIALEAHGLQNAPYAVWYHGENREKHPHAHIAFSLVGWEGESISMSHSYRKNESASRRIESEFPYLGKISMRPKEEAPWGRDKAHRAMRREARISDVKVQKLADIENKNAQGRGSDSELSKSTQGQGVRKMTDAEKLADLARKIKEVLADSDVADLDSFSERVARDTGATVDWWRGPSGEGAIAGWSLVLGGGGTRLKGSEVARSLSFKKIVAALSENERKRSERMRQAGAEADAMAVASVALAKAAKAPVRGFSAATLGPQERTRPIGAPPGPGQVHAKPGVDLVGYSCARNFPGSWQYLDAKGTVFFEDMVDASAVVITPEALDQDPALAIRDWIQLAVSRHGRTLHLQGDLLEDDRLRRLVVQAAADVPGLVIEPLGVDIAAARAERARADAAAAPALPASLDFLNLAAEEDGDEEGGVDPAAGGGAGASTSVGEALQDLGGGHEAEVARLDALAALGLGVSRGSSPQVPQLPGQRDIDGRLRRAHQVAAVAKLLPSIPTEAQAARMAAADLRGVELVWAQLGPVREWASLTAARHLQEATLGHKSATEIALAHAEADARMAGSPLATEVSRLAAADVRAKLGAAKAGFEGMGFLEKATESVSGRRASQISQLEDDLRRSERAALRARADFEESEAGKLSVAEVERRQAAYWAEKEALNQPFIGTLAQALAQILIKLARWVEAAVRRESKDDDARRQREQLVEEARLEAGGAEGQGDGSGSRRERQR